MTSYTPEQVEAAAKLLRFDDPSSGDCTHAADILDAYAATLKAAQGGVTEAMVEEVELLRVQVYDLREANADLRERSAALEAALSAQQGQGEAVFPELLADHVVKCLHDFGRKIDPRLREDLTMAFRAAKALYTAPPAQPAERVPEESYRGVPYRVLGKAFQRALADPNVLWRDNGGAQEFIDRVQEETRLSLLASPAPSPARGDGGEGRSHRWDEDGERCVVCGDKDWMGGPCNGPRTAAQGQPGGVDGGEG